jgi:hypothetical protein
MNTLESIHRYDSVLTQLIIDIKSSDFKTAYFLKLLNLKDSFFYKKMREKRFTTEEVKLISKHLYPEQYQEFKDALLGKLIEKSIAELKVGLGEDFEAIIATSKQQYGL